MEIQSLDEGNHYKYLDIFQYDNIKHIEDKKKIRSEYIRERSPNSAEAISPRLLTLGQFQS